MTKYNNKQYSMPVINYELIRKMGQDFYGLTLLLCIFYLINTVHNQLATSILFFTTTISICLINIDEFLHINQCPQWLICSNRLLFLTLKLLTLITLYLSSPDIWLLFIIESVVFIFYILYAIEIYFNKT